MLLNDINIRDPFIWLMTGTTTCTARAAQAHGDAALVLTCT